MSEGVANERAALLAGAAAVSSQNEQEAESKIGRRSILFASFLQDMAFFLIMPQLITLQKLEQDWEQSLWIAFVYVGAAYSIFPILGGMLGDAKIGKFNAMFVGAFTELIGYGVIFCLNVYRYIHKIEKLTDTMFDILGIGIALSAIGMGFMKPNLLSLGVLQSRSENHTDQRIFFYGYHTISAFADFFEFMVIPYVIVVTGASTAANSQADAIISGMQVVYMFVLVIMLKVGKRYKWYQNIKAKGSQKLEAVFTRCIPSKLCHCLVKRRARDTDESLNQISLIGKRVILFTCAMIVSQFIFQIIYLQQYTTFVLTPLSFHWLNATKISDQETFFRLCISVSPVAGFVIGISIILYYIFIIRSYENVEMDVYFKKILYGLLICTIGMAIIIPSEVYEVYNFFDDVAKGIFKTFYILLFSSFFIGIGGIFVDVNTYTLAFEESKAILSGLESTYNGIVLSCKAIGSLGALGFYYLVKFITLTHAPDVPKDTNYYLVHLYRRNYYITITAFAIAFIMVLFCVRRKFRKHIEEGNFRPELILSLPIRQNRLTDKPNEERNLGRNTPVHFTSSHSTCTANVSIDI